MAFIFNYNFGNFAEYGAYQVLNFFRVQELRKGGEAGDIHKQGGDYLAFAGSPLPTLLLLFPYPKIEAAFATNLVTWKNSIPAAGTERAQSIPADPAIILTFFIRTLAAWALHNGAATKMASYAARGNLPGWLGEVSMRGPVYRPLG